MKKKNLFIIALFIVTLITIPTTSFAAGTPNAPSDVIRKWTFNYVALDSIINKLEQELGYTAGELTMFRDNCKKYLLKTASNPRRFIIVINEDTGEVRINGRCDLHNKFQMLPTGYQMSNKSRLYRQVSSAIQEARSRGIYKKVFKEFKVK